VGLLILLMAPWPACAAWTASGLALEAGGWFTTQAQHRKQPVGRRTRASFVVYFSLVHVNWLLLGLLLWWVGTPEALTCATVLVVAVGTLALLLIYQTPMAFVIAGAAPAIAAMALVAVDAHVDPTRLAPILLIVGLSLLFVLRNARQTPSAIAAQRGLAASEAQYRIMADTISDLIIRVSPDSPTVYLSSPEKLTGYTAAELGVMGLINAVHKGDRRTLEAGRARVTRAGGQASAEHRLIRKDGTCIWLETNMTRAAFNGPDQPPEIISVSRDITARKMLEFALIEAKEQAEAGSAAKSDFLSNMSHELRTPLTAIIGFSGVLKKTAGLEPTAARYAGLINDASTTLLAVVNSVLDFSRLEAEAVELEAAPFDPADLVNSMTALLGLEADGKKIGLHVRAEEAGGPLIGDAPLIRQVLLNLLGNALKFTERGEVTVTVVQSDLDDDHSKLRIEVSDSGIGMSKAQLARVFERFVQAENSTSRRFGGAGLGLAICQRVVQLMGGRIGADSVQGRGSTFWFELDLAKAKAVEIDLDPSTGDELLRRLRVLVVDDVALNRELVTVLLSPFDIDVAVAADGEEAVALARRETYDLILMDVQMPVMDGLTATRAIRKLARPEAAQVPIIALSAGVLPDQVARCLEAGMNDHIGKPINPERLLQTLARWTEPGATRKGAVA
jgi:PAS domain S-box-containing protein